MAVQCKTYQIEGENFHCFTSLPSLQCGGYSKELQMTKSPLFPGAEEGAMVTSDWCISADCILVALTPISWSQHFYKCLFSVWTLYAII